MALGDEETLHHGLRSLGNLLGSLVGDIIRNLIEGTGSIEDKLFIHYIIQYKTTSYIMYNAAI